MLSRLTGTRRTTAGRLLALVYLFCVLAPAMSFAFADGARAAPCLTEDKLGMGIVQSLVEEHRGTLTITSSPGRGTSATVSLPIDDAALSSSASAEGDGRKARTDA